MKDSAVVEQVKPGDYVAVKVVVTKTISNCNFSAKSMWFILLFRYMKQRLRFLEETVCSKLLYHNLYTMLWSQIHKSIRSLQLHTVLRKPK
jgi:ribosomal protein L19E